MSYTMAVLVLLAASAAVKGTTGSVVVSTWGFSGAGEAAWQVLKDGSGSALDAVEAGCSRCEADQCDGSVGFGGSPDEQGETRLDSMLMDGTTFNVGAVASMGRIKSAAAVARRVLENTKHTLLVGDLATKFAVQMGFEEESLSTNHSTKMWQDWKSLQRCQPNFWTRVLPDPGASCGPYRPLEINAQENLIGSTSRFGDRHNHDTIGMVALDSAGNVAAGTSTNGAAFKIPGRVGDSAIPGSGAYADSDVGGAAATGDGDVMMRFVPSFLAVELMRSGYSPQMAARTSLERIVSKHPDFSGAVVALSKEGRVGAACHGLAHPFPFTVGSQDLRGVKVFHVNCIDSSSPLKNKADKTQ